MKTFLAIALLSLTLNLVYGYEYSEVEDRGSNSNSDSSSDSSSSSSSEEDSNEQMMDISETKKCYVYGQCQEYSIDFKDTEDPEGCHKFCSKNKECNWWSWEPDFKLCILYTNCTGTGIDPPDVDACGDCISGQKLCPARECHGAFKCKGDFVDSFAIATLEACIEKCNKVDDCQWFTLEKKNDHCILYEECHDQFDCDTCATGEKKCAHGYKGTTPKPTTASAQAIEDAVEEVQGYTKPRSCGELKFNARSTYCDLEGPFTEVSIKCKEACGEVCAVATLEYTAFDTGVECGDESKWKLTDCWNSCVPCTMGYGNEKKYNDMVSENPTIGMSMQTNVASFTTDLYGGMARFFKTKCEEEMNYSYEY